MEPIAQSFLREQELIKIAEDSMSPEDRKAENRGRLKALPKVLAATGVGAGAGYGTGWLARKGLGALRESSKRLDDVMYSMPRSSKAKYLKLIPMLAGGLGGAATALHSAERDKVYSDSISKEKDKLSGS